MATGMNGSSLRLPHPTVEPLTRNGRNSAVVGGAKREAFVGRPEKVTVAGGERKASVGGAYKGGQCRMGKRWPSQEGQVKWHL